MLEEARFFGLESLVPQLEAMIATNQRSRDTLPLSRRDVINALVCTPVTAELRFQGVNLAGSDLSRLDLRYINFKVPYNFLNIPLTFSLLSFIFANLAKYMYFSPF